MFEILSAILVPKLCLMRSFLGLISVLSSPTALCSGKESKGLDTKKPQNYLIVCGLSLSD